VEPRALRHRGERESGPASGPRGEEGPSRRWIEAHRYRYPVHRKATDPLDSRDVVEKQGHKRPFGLPRRKDPLHARQMQCPTAPQLPRKPLGWYPNTISAHGDYAWYHNKFQHWEADIRCTCATPARGQTQKGPEHLVHCAYTRKTIHKWPRPSLRCDLYVYATFPPPVVFRQRR
jgi:hypothetical protein